MDDAPPGEQVAEELETLLTSWLRHLRAAKLSQKTINTYGYSVRSFIGYIRDAADAAGDVGGITRGHIEDWMLGLEDAGRKPNTLLTRFTNMRTFLAWLVEEEELAVNVMTGMREPKVVQQPVEVLELDALSAMVGTCKGKAFTAVRDEALIRALAEGGMRRAEIAGLDVADVDMDQEVFWVRGKGGKMRAVPFTAKTARALDRYLRARRKHKDAKVTAKLWLGSKGHLTAEGVRMMLARRAKLAGLGHVHPHQFRHTAAHQLRLAGMNDQDMRRIFGWGKNSRQLERYGESAADERAREAHRRLSFGDQI